MSGWKCYQNVMLPDCKPHEEPDITVFDEKNCGKSNGKKFCLQNIHRIGIVQEKQDGIDALRTILLT